MMKQIRLHTQPQLKDKINMVFRLFLILLTLFFSTIVPAQISTSTCDPHLDSIKKIGIEPTINHLKGILNTGSRCPDDFLYYQLALYSMKNSDFQEAKRYAKMGLDIALKENGNFLADIYNTLGTLYNYEGANDSSVYFYIESAKILDSQNEIYYSALVENNIGMIFNQMFDYPSAEKYYRKSSDKLRELNDSTYLSTVLANLAVAQMANGDTIVAEKTISESIHLGTKYEDYVGLTICYALNSSIFQHRGNSTKAQLAGLKALEYAKMSNSHYSITDAYNNLAEIYLLADDGINAEKYALESKTFMESTGNLQNYAYVLKYLSDAYLLQGRYPESRDYLLQHLNFKDSISNAEIKLEQSELLVQYETEKKENLLLKQNLELEQLSSRNLRLIFLVLFIFLAVIFTFLFYKSKIKNKELELARVKSETRNQITEALLQGEENERLRLSKEIHDGLGSLLTATHLHISNLQNANPEFSEDLKIPIELVRKTHDECRRVAHNLMPVTLYESGLQAAIEEHIKLLEGSGSIQIEFSFVDLSEEVISPNLKLFVFRVIQELINNSIKHGNASKIFVQISQNLPTLNITVEDNGNGIDESKTDKGKGLMSLKKNLLDLGGILDIDSKLKEGTSVYIEINMLKW